MHNCWGCMNADYCNNCNDIFPYDNYCDNKEIYEGKSEEEESNVDSNDLD